MTFLFTGMIAPQAAKKSDYRMAATSVEFPAGQAGADLMHTYLHLVSWSPPGTLDPTLGIHTHMWRVGAGLANTYSDLASWFPPRTYIITSGELEPTSRMHTHI